MVAENGRKRIAANNANNGDGDGFATKGTKGTKDTKNTGDKQSYGNGELPTANERE